MTATTDGPAAGAGAGPTARTRSGSLRARQRSTLLILGGLLLAVALVAVLAGGPRTTTDLDPDNPDPGGAQAVARVLEREGVDVEVARSAEELEATVVDARTTVLVVSPEHLGRSTIDRLLEHTAGAADVVVAGAPPGATEALGVDTAPSTVSLGEGREARCGDPVVEGLVLRVDTALQYAGDGCFEDRPTAGEERGAVLIRPRPGVVLFGADQALTNDQVLRGDNAAVALRLLGQQQRLVWYVPDLRDLAAEDGVSLSTLVPAWVRPTLFLLVPTVLALMLWRGRRLGALSTEPLPVVVRAIETTRSRGRLYRRAADRGHAAEALRAASRRRTAERLRLGAADHDQLVRAVAARTGRTESAVAALLAPGAPAPASDPDLITLAADLAALEEEVRRT